MSAVRYNAAFVWVTIHTEVSANDPYEGLIRANEKPHSNREIIPSECIDNPRPQFRGFKTQIIEEMSVDHNSSRLCAQPKGEEQVKAGTTPAWNLSGYPDTRFKTCICASNLEGHLVFFPDVQVKL
ncbi:hypothetical protein E3N88_12020 [Mikania micrantha]|uniref:Uncharacterized protein n=1 Tax=Mikania micrantha TaxID=192012 RepID=A0A5N6P632_9ASTR|nr:hypothetical protein E3N88_12020 [Mikania micrantha]